MVLIDSSQWVWLSHTLQTISRWCCILLHNVAWSIQKSLIRRHQCPSANLTLALRTSHPAGWDNLVGQSLGWRFVEVNYLPLSLKERCLVCWNERSLSKDLSTPRSQEMSHLLAQPPIMCDICNKQASFLISDRDVAEHECTFVQVKSWSVRGRMR